MTPDSIDEIDCLRFENFDLKRRLLDLEFQRAQEAFVAKYKLQPSDQVNLAARQITRAV